MLHASDFRRSNAAIARPRLVESRRRKDEQERRQIVDPFVLAEKYGAEALRYYLMSDIATGKDADFSEERLVERYNEGSRKLAREFAQSHAEHGRPV